MRFSVVIAHRDGAELLLQALSHLQAALDPARDEVWLVDNGSRDDSLARVRAAYPHVHVIENGCNNGFGRACNQAIRQSTGEFVLLLNNDAHVQPDALDRFEQNLRELPRAAIVAGQLYGPDGSTQRSHGVLPTVRAELGLGRQPLPKLAPDRPNEVETVVGACMAVHRAAIAQAGLLDEAFFFYFEETEWCARLRRHGWQVWLDPRIRVTHLKGASTRTVRRGAQVEMLRSRLLFYRRVFTPRVAALLTAWRIARLIVNGLLNAALLLLTAGLNRRLRNKVAIYGTQVAWLALGCPRSWGLPDKCPERGRRPG
ncbi:MAG: glycosyltransferase family 2 protein [Betaproteobacteria bacterium]|nr:glycosyltransferase family 2 protein [Betaproteobacteria bacterium]